MLVTKDTTQAFAKREAGGKGYNLFLMTRQGLPVPPWAILGRRYFDEFVTQTGIKERLALILSSSPSPSTAAQAIEHLIMAQALPYSLCIAVEEAVQTIGSGAFAVRSSAADEDSTRHSFAGQLSSYLYVDTVEEACRFLKLCWISAFSERCLAYRRENQLDPLHAAVAVIFQHMVDSDRSGVLFTCDPIAKQTDRYLVSAVFGVGEGLVSGALDADNYWLDAANGHVVQTQIAVKCEAFHRGVAGETRRVSVEAAQQQQPALSTEELQQLYALGKQLDGYYHHPQDVEWAFENGRLYLLQTRPVTTLDRNVRGYPNLWDNSNIIESYGGVTLPLSFTFALRNYHNVYQQFCEILSVPPAIVREMDDYLAHMLGCLRGRVYYNLYNWYKLVGVLPGFKQNRQFMETMMGVSESLSEEIAQRIKPHASWETWRGRWRRSAPASNLSITTSLSNARSTRFCATSIKNTTCFVRATMDVCPAIRFCGHTSTSNAACSTAGMPRSSTTFSAWYTLACCAN